MVSHGPTTGSVPLVDALLCIKQHAFAVTSYPLIISLDNSCSTNAQTKTAEVIRIVLDTLLAPPDCELLTPETLQNKIIVRGKKVAALSEGAVPQSSDPAKAVSVLTSNPQLAGDSDSDSNIFVEKEDNALNLAVASSELVADNGIQHQIELRRSSFTTQVTPKRSITDSITQMKQLMRSKAPVSPALSELVLLPSTRLPLSMQATPNMTYSVAWARTELALADPSEKRVWAEFAKHSLVRVFPQSLDCCNFDPNATLRAGVQMVALNLQTVGRELEMLRGWFKQNGACGYVLKPPNLGQSGTEKWNDTKLKGDNQLTEPGLLLHLAVEFGWNCSLQNSSENDVYVEPSREIAALEACNEEAAFLLSAPSATGVDTPTHLWVEISGTAVECKRIRTKQVQTYSGVTAWHEDFIFAFESRQSMELASCYMAVVGSRDAGVVAEGCFAVRSLRCGDSVVRLRHQHNPEFCASVLCHMRTEEKHMLENDLADWQSVGSVESHVLEAIGIDLC